MRRRTFLKIGTGAALGGALAACGGGDAAPGAATLPGGVVTGWNKVALQAIRSVRPGAPMAARSLAVVHTSMYNAWTAYDTQAMPTLRGGAPRRPRGEHSVANKAMAISHAAHAALCDQFASQTSAFGAHLRTLGYDPGAASSDPATPVGVGAAMAARVLAYCHDDGANQLGKLTPSGVPYADYTGYASSNPPMAVNEPTPLERIPAPGHWQPLTYADASAKLITPGFLGACWPRIIPFALRSASQFRPAPPAAFGTPEYVAQARRIVEVQLALTEQHKVAAEYWADGPNSELPPGHWCLFAQFVSARDSHTDDDDVKMFFALTCAVSDAGIAAWDAKRTYDSERPITAIRYLMNDQTINGYGLPGPAGGLRPIPGAAWMPYQPTSFPTPPFPDHVSGHSAFSAAAAAVLQSFTGSDAFGASHTSAARSLVLESSLPSRDLVLRWDRFSDAALEAGISRVYGGIHFDNANDAGLALGRKVGALAYQKAQRHWQGQA
jgi:hypothetical protein